MYTKRTIQASPICTSRVVYADTPSVHDAYMTTRSQKVVPRFKPRLRRTYFREWRKHRELTLELAAERVGDFLREHGIADGYTHATLGRLERGLVAYTQPVLEALAFVYQTDPASLLMRNPTDSEALWSIWDNAKQAEREQIVEIARTLTRKTGTGN